MENILIEQYKLYVESADRVSERRGQVNNFYISVLTALLIILSLVVEKNVFSDQHNLVFLSIGLLGILLCIVWRYSIESHRQLNTAKFKVIHEMETKLPFACFDIEWDHLGRGEDSNKYRKVTTVEKFVPLILACPYLILLGFAICQMICT